MRRRTLLRTVGAGVLGVGSGCLGNGGKVVVSVSKSVRIKPGFGWVKEIPDVSDPGGAILYTVRSDEKPFDVYFFTSKEEYDHYDAFIEGENPPKTPRGHSSFSQAAVPNSDSKNVYEASTANEGAREPLNAPGPYYFVVDHSDYRMENRVDEHGDPLSAFVELEVVRKNLPI